MPTAEGSDNGKILKLKDGEALCVLRDIFHGRTAKHGRSCPAVLFHVHLLSVINEEEGEKVAKPNPSSWFSVLEKYFAESEHVLKMLGKHYLEKAADHDALNASEMLRVLNLLCIHALGTKKLRNWIKHQKTQFDQKAEEAIHKVFEAKGEKIKEDAAKAIDARDGELEAIVSLNRSAAEQAHGKLLESEAMLLKLHQTADATRVEPTIVLLNLMYGIKMLGKRILLRYLKNGLLSVRKKKKKLRRILLQDRKTTISLEGGKRNWQRKLNADDFERF